MEFTREQMKDIAEGIVRSNREYPLKPKTVKCGTCRKFRPGTDGKVRCEKYLEGIPMEILTGKETCEEYRRK